MLILGRRVGEQIVVPACRLTVTVLGIDGRKVRLGISAPRSVTVHRKEVLRRIVAARAFNVAATEASEHPNVHSHSDRRS